MGVHLSLNLLRDKDLWVLKTPKTRHNQSRRVKRLKIKTEKLNLRLQSKLKSQVGYSRKSWSSKCAHLDQTRLNLMLSKENQPFVVLNSLLIECDRQMKTENTRMSSLTGKKSINWMTFVRNVVAKNYTGSLTVVQPFTFNKSKRASSKAQIILDVEITIPSGKVANLRIHEGDSIQKSV